MPLAGLQDERSQLKGKGRLLELKTGPCPEPPGWVAAFLRELLQPSALIGAHAAAREMIIPCDYLTLLGIDGATVGQVS